MNAPDDEVQAEIERQRQLRQRPAARVFVVVEKTLERLVLICAGFLIVYFGWRAAKFLHQPIGNKPIGSLTLNEIGSNLFAGVVAIVSLGIAAKVAFSAGIDRERMLLDQARKYVRDRRRSEAAYQRSTIWGVLNDPNPGRSGHGLLAVALLAGILTVLAMIFVFASRVH